ARALFDRFPELPEGELSRVRAHLVNKDMLAQVARRLGLGSAIRLGEGEFRSGGADRASILADAMEAVFGAVFLDGGYEAARGTIDAAYGDLLRDADPAVLGKIPRRACRNGCRRAGCRCPSTRSSRRAAMRTRNGLPSNAGLPAS